MLLRIILFTILTAFAATTAVAGDSWESSLSLWGSEHIGGGACTKDHVVKPDPAAAKNGFSESCQNKDLKAKLKSLSKISEANFFDESAKEYLARNKCWEQKVETLDAAKKTAVANNIKAALPDIVEMYRQLQKLQLDKVRYVSWHFQSDDMANNARIRAATAELDQQIAEKTKEMNEKVSSTWLGTGHFLARKGIIDFAADIANHPSKYGSNYAASFSVKDLDENILKPMLKNLQDEQINLLQKSDQGKPIVAAGFNKQLQEQRQFAGAPSEGELFLTAPTDDSANKALLKLDTKNLHFDLDDGEKIRLFKENGMGKALLGSTPENFRQNMSFYCEMDGRYGKARENFDAVESGVEFAATLVLPAAPYMLAAGGLMSAEAAETAALLMRGGSTFMSAKQAMQESCGTQAVESTVGNSCSSADISSADFAKDLAAHQCLTKLAMTGVSIVPVAVKGTSMLAKASDKAAAARFAAQAQGVAMPTKGYAVASTTVSDAEKSAANAAADKAIAQAAAKEAEAKRIASVPSSKEMPALTGIYDPEPAKVTDLARFERQAHVFKAGSNEGEAVLGNLPDGTYPYLIDSENNIAIVNRTMIPLGKDDPTQMLGHHKGLQELLEKINQQAGKTPPKIVGGGEIVVRNGKIVQALTNKAGNARGGAESLDHSKKVLIAAGLKEPKETIDVSKKAFAGHTAEAAEAKREVEYRKDPKISAVWDQTREVMAQTMKQFPDNKAFVSAVVAQMQIDMKVAAVDSPQEKALGFVGTFVSHWSKPQEGETFALMKVMTRPDDSVDPARMQGVIEFMKKLKPPAATPGQ